MRTVNGNMIVMYCNAVLTAMKAIVDKILLLKQNANDSFIYSVKHIVIVEKISKYIRGVIKK